jgi:hypothetical protein
VFPELLPPVLLLPELPAEPELVLVEVPPLPGFVLVDREELLFPPQAMSINNNPEHTSGARARWLNGISITIYRSWRLGWSC